MGLRKKGIGAMTGERLVTNFYGILLFLLIIAVFAFLFYTTVQTYQSKFTASAKDLTTNTSIIAYLRSPITVEGTRSTVAEAFARAAATDSFEPLHADLKEFLDGLPKPHPSSGWRYSLILQPEGQELDSFSTFDIVGWYEQRRLTFLLPSYDPNHYLEVIFALECQAAECAG